MKVAILLLLGLASLAVAAPQSRFGTSRYQPAAADSADDTTDATDVADDAADEGDTDDADLDATGPDAVSPEDDTKDTTGRPYVVDGEKRPAYGLDSAKERRRLANLRKRFRPNANEEASVTDSPEGEGEEAPAVGNHRASAGQQDSNNDESTPEEDEESQSAPVSPFRRRFHSTSSSSSSVSDASAGNDEETAPGSSDTADQAAVEPAHERRRPALRRRQQSTTAPSEDDQAQYESSDAGSSANSEVADSASPAEDQEPAAGTRRAGSLEERLERYRQRQAERLGTATHTAAADSSADDQSAGAESDAAAESGSAAGAGPTDFDFKNSGEEKTAKSFTADFRHERKPGAFTSSDNSNGQDS